VTQAFKVDPELKQYIRPLTEPERQQLERLILAEGCRDPLVIWQEEGVLLDGHSRLEICQAHNKPYRTVELSFKSRTDALIWMIENQFGRRNLPTWERCEYALMLEPLYAAQAKERQREHSNTAPGRTRTLQQKSAEVSEGLQDSMANEQLAKKGDKAPVEQKSAERTKAAQDRTTNEQLAKKAGVSHDTIHKVKVIKERAAPEVIERICQGEEARNKRIFDLRPGTRTFPEEDLHHEIPISTPEVSDTRQRPETGRGANEIPVPRILDASFTDTDAERLNVSSGRDSRLPRTESGIRALATTLRSDVRAKGYVEHRSAVILQLIQQALEQGR